MELTCQSSSLQWSVKFSKQLPPANCPVEHLVSTWAKTPLHGRKRISHLDEQEPFQQQIRL